MLTFAQETFVAGFRRGSEVFVGLCARQRNHFLLLRQEKVSKGGRAGFVGLRVRCAVQVRRGARKLGCASNMRAPDPPNLGLLASSLRRQIRMPKPTSTRWGVYL